MKRVIVVGGGVGGLAAAVRLAERGHRVEVHERAPVVGGKLGRYTRDGLTFDTGPSLLTLPEVFAGLDLDLVPVDPACSYRFADGTRWDVPHDPAAVPAALDAALGPGAGAAWSALHGHTARLWELTGDAVLRRPLHGVRDLLRFSAHLRDLGVIAPWRTLRGLGERMLPDPRLRAWLDRYATYSGSDPRRVPSALAVTAYVEQQFGAWWVRGGLRRIVDALLARCAALGVEVHTGSEVTRVHATRRGVSGVTLASGRSLAAGTVVSDADARHLYGHLLPPALAPAARRSVRRATRSSAGFVLLLAVEGPPAGPAHRVWFGPDRDADFDAIFSGRLAPDPTVYAHVPDDPALRRDDRAHPWFVLVNAPSSGVEWARVAERYADHVLDVLAERGEDVRGRVRWREVRTPADLERDTAAPGGAIYGSAAHGPLAGLLRPANRSPVPGLYLVGGSAHPGGGLPLVMLSASIVADLVGPA